MTSLTRWKVASALFAAVAGYALFLRYFIPRLRTRSRTRLRIRVGHQSIVPRPSLSVRRFRVLPSCSPSGLTSDFSRGGHSYPAANLC